MQLNGSSFLESPSFTFGEQDFTIDFRVNASSSTDLEAVTIFSTSYDGWKGMLRLLFYKPSSIRLACTDSNASDVIYRKVEDVDNLFDTTHHCEVAYRQEDFTYFLFLDGILILQANTTKATERLSRAFSLGRAISNNAKMTGYLDEFRLSQGIVRHTQDFTPPITPYEVDQFTVALLHF